MENRNFENENNHQNCEHNKNSGHKKHGLLMLLCCLLPVALIGILPILGIKSGALLSGLAFLLCPLMHIGMMFMMGKSGGGQSCHGSSKPAEINEK